MSTLLPSFIVFLELKQAKFFWSVLLIFGKTESFLFHFLFCLLKPHAQRPSWTLHSPLHMGRSFLHVRHKFSQ